MRTLIVIPTYNRPKLLQETLLSVSNQVLPASHVIVIGKVIPVDTYGMDVETVYSDDPLYKKANQAIESCDCDAFSLVCDDDKLDPYYLLRTTQFMDKTNVDIVYTNLKVFGKTEWESISRTWTRNNIDNNTVPSITALIKKSIWSKVGGYAGLPLFDWEFYWRCYYNWATAYHLKEALFYWRCHDEQDTATGSVQRHRQELLNHFRLLKEEYNAQGYIYPNT